MNKKRDIGFRHILKYIGILGSVNGLKMLVGAVRTKLSAVLLHSDGVGINTIYLRVAEFVNTLTNMGVAFGAVRNLSEIFENGTEEEQRNYVRVIRTWSVWTAILGAAICLLLSPLLNRIFFENNSLSGSISLLSIYVFLLPIEAGECAILKGMRRLKTLALVELLTVFGTLLATVPFYLVMGLPGIVLALICSGLVLTGTHLVFTTRIFRYNISLFSARICKQGLPLLRMGIPYVLAGVSGSLTTLYFYSILDGTSEVGLYDKCYQLVVVYASIVFAAMEADYFPRLSGLSHDRPAFNHAVNQQIEANLVLVTPLMIGMVLLLPVAIPLLFSAEFMPILPMAVAASAYNILRAFHLPISYITLAKGNTWLFLIMEVTYNFALLGLLILGYRCWGLTGLGAALSAATLFDVFLVTTVYSLVFHFRLQRRTVLLFLCELGLFAAVVPFCFDGALAWPKLAIGVLAFAVSCIVGWRRVRNRN